MHAAIFWPTTQGGGKRVGGLCHAALKPDMLDRLAVGARHRGRKLCTAPNSKMLSFCPFFLSFFMRFPRLRSPEPATYTILPAAGSELAWLIFFSLWVAPVLAPLSCAIFMLGIVQHPTETVGTTAQHGSEHLHAPCRRKEK